MQKFTGKLARMYPLMIAMGFTIVIMSVRETSLLAQRALFESTALWLPTFKFLGLGLILGGIVMALRVIILNSSQAQAWPQAVTRESGGNSTRPRDAPTRRRTGTHETGPVRRLVQSWWCAGLHAYLIDSSNP